MSSPNPYEIPRCGALLTMLDLHIKPRPRKILLSPTHLFAHYQNVRVYRLCLCFPKSPHFYGMFLFSRSTVADAMTALSWLCCRYKATVANLPSSFNKARSYDQTQRRTVACLLLQTWSLRPTCSCLLKQRLN